MACALSHKIHPTTDDNNDYLHYIYMGRPECMEQDIFFIPISGGQRTNICKGKKYGCGMQGIPDNLQGSANHTLQHSFLKRQRC